MALQEVTEQQEESREQVFDKKCKLNANVSAGSESKRVVNKSGSRASNSTVEKQSNKESAGVCCCQREQEETLNF